MTNEIFYSLLRFKGLKMFHLPAKTNNRRIPAGIKKKQEKMRIIVKCLPGPKNTSLDLGKRFSIHREISDVSARLSGGPA